MVDDLSPTYDYERPLKVVGSFPLFVDVADVPLNEFVSVDLFPFTDVSSIDAVSQESMLVSSNVSAPGSFPIFSDKMSE